MEWQPIETAARKGFATYLGRTEKYGAVVVDYIPPPSSRSPESWRTVPGRWEVRPTHWTPLPKD